MLLCFTLLGMTAQNKAELILDTENKRCAYLNKNGAENVMLVECKNIYIPYEFDQQLEIYNDCIKECGYDLTLHKGKEALLYVYDDGDELYHIYTCDGRLIAADKCKLSGKNTVALMKE